MKPAEDFFVTTDAFLETPALDKKNKKWQRFYRVMFLPMKLQGRVELTFLHAVLGL